MLSKNDVIDQRVRAEIAKHCAEKNLWILHAVGTNTESLEEDDKCARVRVSFDVIKPKSYSTPPAEIQRQIAAANKTTAAAAVEPLLCTVEVIIKGTVHKYVL